MMLIEQYIEQQIINALSEIITDFDIVGSWVSVPDGEIKCERLTDKKGLISIFISPRRHDSFSLPTVNLDGALAIEFRVEQCPTMSDVAITYKQVVDLFNNWHINVETFSDYFTNDEFFASAIMLNGGGKVSLDRVNQKWIIDISFTIRGTQI